MEIVAPPPTPTPTPTPTLTPTPFIAYRDNFNDPNSGWAELNTQNYDFEYIGGEYRMLVKATGQTGYSNAPPSIFSDFDIVVSARYEGAALRKSYGLNFRHDSRDNFYLFLINPTSGIYSFFKRERGTWAAIIPWTPTPDIILGTTSNVLRVIARGSRFELYANGKLLDTAVDQTFTAGRIGLFVQNSADPNGAEVFFDGLIVRVFKPAVRTLSAKSLSAIPGESLTLIGSGFDLDAPTFVMFTDQAGNETRVRSVSVTARTVEVAVPAFLDVGQFQIRAGMVTVSVVQELPGNTIAYGPVDNFQIADLPQTGLAPGTVTLEFLDQTQNLLGSTARAWQTIEDASLGSVDTLSMRTNLLALQEQVMALRIPIQKLVDGEVQQVDLGEISGQRVFLDSDSLQLMDRMFVAYYLSDRNLGTAKTASLLRVPLQWGACQTVIECMKEELNPFNAESTQEIFDKFDNYGKIGQVAVGVAALGAITFGAVPAATAAAVAGTAGAVIFSPPW